MSGTKPKTKTTQPTTYIYIHVHSYTHAYAHIVKIEYTPASYRPHTYIYIHAHKHIHTQKIDWMTDTYIHTEYQTQRKTHTYNQTDT